MFSLSYVLAGTVIKKNLFEIQSSSLTSLSNMLDQFNCLVPRLIRQFLKQLAESDSVCLVVVIICSREKVFVGSTEVQVCICLQLARYVPLTTEVAVDGITAWQS